jgi:hypothetical protein
MRLTITSAVAVEMMLIMVALMLGGATAQAPDFNGCNTNSVRT